MTAAVIIIEAAIALAKPTIAPNITLIKVAFNQSSIGTSTKKALETAVAKVVKRMMQKGVFDH